MDLQEYSAQDLDRLRQEQGATPDAPPPPVPSAPSSAATALQDPTFRAFLAQRAQELGLAQDQARKDQRWADLANASVKSSAALDGKDPDRALLDANNARAQRPVAEALQRQASGDAATKDFEGQQAIGIKSQASGALLESMTAGTPVSKRGYLLAVAQGLVPPGYPADQYTESMRQDMLKGASIQQAREKNQAAIAEMKARMALESRKADEEVRHHHVEESLQGQRELPANVTTEIGSLISGANGLADLSASREDAGITGAIADKLGFGDYHGVKSAVASEVAKADSKGRVNPSGAARLEQQLPGAMTPGGGKNLQVRQKALLDQAEQRIRELERGRHNPAQVAELRADLEAARARMGGGQGVTTKPVPSHYLISPDRKQRMPADASGKPIGPAEPNPNG